MKDPSNVIRQWLYGVLNGTVAYNSAYIPVYSFAPKDAVMPYIVIGEQTMDAEDSPKDCFITSNNVVIEVYASYTGNDATYKAVNSIAEDILEIVRQRAIEQHGSGGQLVATMPGYNPISVTFQGGLTDRILLENMIVVFKQITLNLEVEELDAATQLYTDWWLPSKDELNAMYTQLHAYGLGSFTAGSYWSSTEKDATLAWLQLFTDGSQSVTTKTLLYNVRACRRFTAATGEYSIRDLGPAGGYIFAISGNYFYESSAVDQAVSYAWSNVTTAIGATAQGEAIGTGQANTSAIIAQIGHTGSAAKQCNDYSE